MASFLKSTKEMLGLSDNPETLEGKLKLATNNDPWGPSGTQMKELSQASHQYQYFRPIMEHLWERLDSRNRYTWRQVYKTLTLLDYMLKNGSDQVAKAARANLMEIQGLTSFQMREEGKDVGLNVREKTKAILELLADDAKLKAEREKARSSASKYKVAISNNAPTSYSGFGSDSMSYPDHGSSSYGQSSSPSRSGGGGGFQTGATFTNRIQGSSPRGEREEEEEEEEEEPQPQQKAVVKQQNLLDLDDGTSAHTPSATKSTSLPPDLFGSSIAQLPSSSFDSFDFDPRGSAAPPVRTAAPQVEWDAFTGSSTVTPAAPVSSSSLLLPTGGVLTPTNSSATPTPTPAPVSGSFWDMSTPAPAVAASNQKPEVSLPEGDPWKNKHLFGNLEIGKTGSGASTSKVPMGGAIGMGAMGAPAKKSAAPVTLQPSLMPTAAPPMMPSNNGFQQGRPGMGMQGGMPGMMPGGMQGMQGGMPGMMPGGMQGGMMPGGMQGMQGGMMPGGMQGGMQMGGGMGTPNYGNGMGFKSNQQPAPQGSQFTFEWS